MRPDVVAEFTDADQMLRAVELLRSSGFSQVETYAPAPVSGEAERVGLHRPWLSMLVFGGGLLGAVLGYGIQWYANVWDYPYNVGGRPVHPVAAFIPATFEAAVLAAALTAFVGFFALIGLPALWHPVFEVEEFDRASIDRYWVGIGRARDPIDLTALHRLLEPLHPLRVVPVEVRP
jgi:hypothetical protein